MSVNTHIAVNASSTIDSAAATAQKLTATAVNGLRVIVDKVSGFIRAASSTNDIVYNYRFEVANGSAYTYTNGTGVFSAITFTNDCNISNIHVGDYVVDSGTLTTYTVITAVSASAGTFTTASGLSATYNGGAFKIYRIQKAVIGAGSPTGEGFEISLNMQTCKNGQMICDVDAGSTGCITIANIPYRYG